MRTIFQWTGLVLVVVLAGAACGGGGKSSGNTSSNTTTANQSPIKIGFPADLSKVYSYYDGPLLAGAKFAIQQINNSGGVLGRKLVLTSMDQQNNTPLTTKDTQQLINQGVVYLMGTTGDGILSEGTLACNAGIPVSTGDGTAPTLVGDMGKCAFQLVMSDNVQAALDAQYALKKGYKTAYVIGSPDVPYTKNLPTYFTKVFVRGGGKVVGTVSYHVGSGDYSALVTRLAGVSPKPDVIFTPMFPPDTQVFMRQLRQAGVSIPVISTDGNYDASLKSAGAKALNGFVFSASTCPPDPGTPLGKFYAQYKKGTGKEPDSAVVGLGYDEIGVLKAAIEKAGSADPAAIIKALDTINYQGVTGDIKMDPKTRRAKKPVALVKVVGTTFTCLEQAYPTYVPPVH